MKITKVSCSQFAGVRDRDVSFEDGINVIYGKNESGKSTLVNLLSRTLFQNARIDGRKDKEFRNLYFPGAIKGSSITGDFADGKITFTTESGTYTLTKEWGVDSRCTLSTPVGTIRDQKKIDEILREALSYGEGVYTDMLFSSQRNTDLSLQTILDATKKTDAKQEIVDTVSQAFAESDGVSADAIEQAIQAKIDEIAGKHWDFGRETPVRKAGRWANGLGEILKAYYAVEDAAAVLTRVSELGDAADRAAKNYADQDNIARQAEEAYNSFNTFASRLAVQSERKKAIDRIGEDIRKTTGVLESWPRLADSLAKAKTLRAEKAKRALLDQYEAAKKISSDVTDDDRTTATLPCPADGEIAQVRTTQRQISSLENKLCGMNITAAIHMLGGNKVEITSLRTGEPVDLSNGTAAITEAVKVTIPGVMEMQLAPANVDVASVEAQLDELRDAARTVFDKYGLETLEELEERAKVVSTAKSRIDSVANRLSSLLGTTSFEELEADATAIGDTVRPKAAIEGDIRAVCGNADPESFIVATETKIEGYTSDYGSINDLEAKISELSMELDRAEKSLSDTDDIPAEYLGISDPDDYLERLQTDLKTKQKKRDEALAAKTAAASKLESYRENIGSDPEADAERAERILEEQKTLLKRWLHIAEVFRIQKENVHNNPMQDIAASFTRYLGIISDNRISSEFPEAEKLDMSIYSDNKLLDYAKLSEGTKETVSLAFRLAVLDHLFPEGGGVIVFDDPFTDMDAERTAQSCELIKECAKRHQVIFLTCKEEYIDVLQGHTIRF